MSRVLPFARVFAACCPLLAAFAAQLSNIEPTQVTEAAPLSPLVFRQYAVNLREVPPQPTFQAHFDFMNRGDHPVRITNLDPSCGCLRPVLHGDKTEYEPGETGRFYVTMHTANVAPGPHGYSVDVEYSGREQHTESLAFRITLPQKKLSVEPAEVFFYQLSGEAGEQTIHVTDYRGGRPLNVTAAHCDSEVVTVEILPAGQDDDGNPRVPLRISVPEGVPPGRQTALVKIETDDPEFRRVYAAVLVEGPAITPVGFESEKLPTPIPPEGGR
ncbi:MAG: DUF1573 domain-containing protein [Planctomycetota bacterium]|nr:MAG: DUF1573 domain-containing protein [Planctomycetota bacterium]REJ90598.1 MAG: DUF1573 domain-containing protein [Planctomycetota bacterium]REK30029.1 MAG: DUF1573 domain-containing protein [Planctomycetota bacterium]REK37728.1 MAG: DUF1573 domain-containing protein [Planctomycetota bacterium]